MIINPGDKVRFLNDVGGGTVIRVVSKGMVLIKSNDDFEYEVPAKELVVIEPAKNTQPQTSHTTEKVKTSSESSKSKEPKPDLKEDDNCEIHLAFIKSQKKDQEIFTCYLLNDSNYYLFFNIVSLGSNGLKKLEADKTEPNTMYKVHNFTRDEINNTKEIIVQIIFHSHKYDILKNQIQRNIKIQPIKFYNEGVFKENDFFDENAYIILLYKDELGLKGLEKQQESIEEIIKDKEFFNGNNSEEKKSKAHKKPQTIEIDLHINQLVDSVVGLSNHEILNIQMQEFHKKLTEAIEIKATKIVFIHGIGNGTLKSAIRESITTQYKLHYEDASFKEYGFGATMVLIQ